jgi:hypothetical protein
MLKLKMVASAALLLVGVGAYAQENSFGTGGANTMHFNAQDMDVKKDNKITKDEWMAYAEKMWDSMANGKSYLPVATMTEDFAQGGVSARAEKMDTNHDGKISKKEYLAYFSKTFDKMKDPHTETISVQEAAKAIGRGEPPPTS